MHARKLTLAFVAIAITLAGCQEGSTSPTPKRLHRIAHCDELLEVFQNQALDDLRERAEIEAQYYEFYRNYDWGRSYGEETNSFNSDSAATAASGPSPAGASPGSADPSAETSPENYSTTNNQEAAVDEADLVKTDGDYVYLVSAGNLLIIDSWPAEETHEIARLPIEGSVSSLFLHDKLAVVFSSVSGRSAVKGHPVALRGGSVKITVVDLRDRLRPRVVRETYAEGDLVAARLIGSAMHVVIGSSVKMPAQQRLRVNLDAAPSGRTTSTSLLPTTPSAGLSTNWALGSVLTSSAYRENVMSIKDATLDDFVPRRVDFLGGGSAPRVSPRCGCNRFFRPAQATGQQLTSVLSLDLADIRAKYSGSSVVSGQGTVYASPQGLYIAATNRSSYSNWWQSYGSANRGDEEITEIHKFALDGASSSYRGSGAVEGWVLNQFSLSEKDGYLRVFSTTGHLTRGADTDVYNTLFVLRESGGLLKTVAKVSGFGIAEDIRSARFIGDRGYVVTFKKTDPLFVFDLKDPERPTLMGELHIPGFSSYLHPLGDDHLLTIGFEAEEQGSFAYFQGIQLQIFDISDMTDPKLVHKVVIGTRGTSSEATGNHLAFSYYEHLGTLAVPMAICEDSSGGGDYGDRMTFNGVLVYKIDKVDGITEIGRVDHRPGKSWTADTGRCRNWWQNPNSKVKRSLFIEDYVYSISDAFMIVNHIDGLNDRLARLDLQ